jgi:hypothetical protein
MTTPLLYPARAGSYREVVLADQPAFFYEFSDTSFTGGVIRDLSGNGNDGTNLQQSTTPLEAVGQVGNEHCALFPYESNAQARVATNVELTYPELAVECTVSSEYWGYAGANVRLIADGHTDQGGASRSGFEFYLPNAGGNSTGMAPQELAFIVGNGYTPWSASTAYAVGDQASHDGNVYVCTTAGTSGTSGPSGTGTGITDGSVMWSWQTSDNLSCTTEPLLLSGGVYHLLASATVSGGTTTVSIYVNGTLQAENSVANFGTVTSPHTVGVGFNPVYDGDFFCGNMGAVAAYPHGFSPEQAWRHSNAFFTGLQR